MAFKQSRTLKPERFVNGKLIEAIENEESLEAINNLADGLVDRQTLKKMKQSAKEKLDPVGHSYDAVMKYKTKVQDVLKDPFLIYKVDCEKQIVFKTSREQLQDPAVLQLILFSNLSWVPMPSSVNLSLYFILNSTV